LVYQFISPLLFSNCLNNNSSRSLHWPQRAEQRSIQQQSVEKFYVKTVINVQLQINCSAA